MTIVKTKLKAQKTEQNRDHISNPSGIWPICSQNKQIWLTRVTNGCERSHATEDNRNHYNEQSCLHWMWRDITNLQQ